MDSALLPITPPRSDTATPDAERLPLALSLSPSQAVPNLPPDTQLFLNSATPSLVSISTAFHPDSCLQPAPPDVTLLSSDLVFFYVHRNVLLALSQNNFDALLSPPKPATNAPKSPETTPPTHVVIAVTENSQTLNAVLHSIYSLSCAHYSPSPDTLSAAVTALCKYGVPLSIALAPEAPIHALLLAQARTAPLPTYVLAASQGLEDLAVAASQNLHSLRLPDLTDDIAVQIGPLYLKRLFFLHLGRCEALKRTLTSPLVLHAPNADCTAEQLGKVSRAWSLAAAYLVWESRADLPCSLLESTLTPLTDLLWCGVCRQATSDRIREVVAQWSAVKKTI